MRIMFVVLMLTSSLIVKAQTILQASNINHLQQHSFTVNNRFKDSSLNKKWFVNKYIGFSSSFGFFNGGTPQCLLCLLVYNYNAG